MRGEALPPEPQFAESGESLFPHLVQKRVRNDFEGRLRSVVMKDWKLVWNPFQTSTREWELYDLSIDPHEKHNFYTPGHERLPELKQALVQFAHQTATGESAPGLSNDDLEALRAMGYVE